MARLVDRSIKTITILFLYLFINAAVSIVGILGEAAPTIFQPLWGTPTIYITGDYHYSIEIALDMKM